MNRVVLCCSSAIHRYTSDKSFSFYNYKLLGCILRVEGDRVGQERRQCQDFSRKTVGDHLRPLFSYSSIFRFSENLELDDGIHTALLTLRESFDVGMTEDNVEIGICNKNGFQRLTKQQIKDHLGAL